MASVRRLDVFSWVAVGLVFLAALVDPVVTIVLAAVLVVLGFVLFPELRKRGPLAILVAAVIAAALAFLLRGR